MGKRLAGVAAVYFALHVLLLPPTLEDLDSINFALGVRDYDVARHQPHPPGYPIYTAMAKASTAVLHAARVPAAEPRGLALWSAIAGTLLIALLFALFRALDGSPRRAGWATLLVAVSPLAWFNALRPLSDMSGLAAVVAAQALIVSVLIARDYHRMSAAARLLAGAFIAGLAVGVRAQTFVLTLPLLALAMAVPAYPLTWSRRLLAPVAFAAGALAWGIPLLIASGGLGDYLAALGAQGGEDFGGVPILWTMRTRQVLKESLLNTYVWPWGAVAVAAIVLAAAAAGFLRAAWSWPRVAIVLAVAFGPYAVFHPLFHDVANGRNALPLVLPVAYLAMLAFDAGGRYVLAFAATAIALACLAMSVPASLAYAREASPTFAMLEDVRINASGGEVLAMHAGFKRAVEWSPPLPDAKLLKAPHGREWLPLVEHWRANPQSRAWFAADPKRTDLALFDGVARRLMRSYRWPFAEPPYVGGARPGPADLYVMPPPGWMLDRGWALSAEIAGVTARDRAEPQMRPATGWIRSRNDQATLVLGGRHLGGDGDAPARIAIAVNGVPLEEWDVAPGFFVRRMDVPAGRLAGTDGYVPFEVRVGASSGATRVSLEQFDVQSDGVPMVALERGWQEPEYNTLAGTAWRWMSDEAALWVRPVGRDVTLRVSGESPMRYYDAAPGLRIYLGGAEIGQISPHADFSYDAVLPHAALAAADGRVTIRSDKHFVPGEREGTADRRRLAVRMYAVEVR